MTYVSIVITHLDGYAAKYDCVRMERHDGILQITLHTDGGPLQSSAKMHGELPAAFADIGNDLDNRCVIMTGAGDAFWPGKAQGSSSAGTAEGWYRVVKEGTKTQLNFLDIDVPVIAAVNGPWTRHSELAVLSDIVLATPNTVFQDAPHFWNGLVPGDGIAQSWLAALGPNRGRYFLLTGQQLDAQEAYDLGIVNELVEPDELLPRAWELAREIAKRSPLTIRYTKQILVADLRRRLNDELRYTLALEAAAHLDQGHDFCLLVQTKGIDGTGFARRRSP
jgi:enoyl-CoA hydratase/carnithine racemase